MSWRKINSRDILGLCLWFMIALIIGWLAYTIMIARELYQFFSLSFGTIRVGGCGEVRYRDNNWLARKELD